MLSRHSFLPVFAITVVILGPWNLRVIAQEALRNALLTDVSAQLRNQAVVRPPNDVLRIGPVTFDVGVGYSLEASDNIRFSEFDRKSDLINRPSVRLGITYPLSRNSRLTLGGQFGYTDYIKHSEFDTFFITPDSELAYDLRIGDAVVTVYDRFDYSQDVATEAALSGVAEFRRIQNLVGVRAVWRVDKWTLQGGYGHLNVLGEGESLRYLERSDEELFGRVGYHFHTSGEAGMEASADFSDYVLASQNDSITVSVGPFVSWRAGEAFQVSLRGGVAYSIFEATNSMVAGTDVTSYYVGVDADHHLTRHIAHGCSVRHDIRAGINRDSDYIESTHFDYHLAWAFHRNATLNLALFGEFSEDHRVDNAVSALGETYNQFGVTPEIVYSLTRRFSLSARYAFTMRNSDEMFRSYRENRVALGATYRF
jgi:hypothetical protein